MAVFLSPVGGVAAQFFTNTGAVLTGGKLYTYLAGTTTPAATYTSASGATFNTNPIVLDSAGRVPSSGEIWLGEGVQYKFVLKDSNDVLIASYDNITGINSNFVNYNALEEIQVATAGQTVFNLTNSYQPGTNTLSVFVDGVNQYDGSSYSYTETNSTRVTFASGLHVGALVKFTTAVTLSAGVVSSNLVTYQPAGTGAVATTVQAKLRQYVSVKDFGAVGDGVTNDVTAFQNAINAAQTNGLTVFIPAGNYLLNNTITVKSGVALTGQSWCPDNVNTGAVFICRNNLQFVMEANSNISNVNFKYDQQNYTTFVTYPATIVPQSACLIENINYVGGTHFCVQNTSTTIEKPIIRNVYGCPLMVGIDLYDVVDVPKISTIHFNPNSLRQVGITESSTPSIDNVSAQMQQQAEFIRLGRVDWAQIDTVFCYGYRNGVHQYRRTSGDVDSSGGYGINNFGFDYCNTAFLVDRSEIAFPYAINNGWATPLVEINLVNQAFIKLTGAGTRGVTIIANNVKAYGSVTGTNIGPAAFYIIDETTPGTGNNQYNNVLLTNYEFQHNYLNLVSGFTADGSGVRFANGMYHFLPHGVHSNESGIISTNNDDTPIAPSFLNSWANAGSGTKPLGYFKDDLGYVHVSGVVVQTTVGLINTIIFQLPSGYRPAVNNVFDAVCITQAGAIAGVRVYANGNVQQISGSTAAFTMNFSFKP
jgi:Pectate lyase superfamily protein